LRAAEIASIQQAIGVLRSDDARDTFKKSYDSQSFVQLDGHHHHHHHHHHDHRRSHALSMIRKIAKISKDSRVLALATQLADKKEEPTEIDEENPFTEVVSAIDGMISDLGLEEASDLETKENCEKERMDTTNSAKKNSKLIDTNTETIDRHSAEIDASNKTIKEIEAEVSELEEQKTQAQNQRADENTEFLAAKADDEKAVELVGNAITALKSFYEREDLKFVQVRRVTQPFVESGEAPTPPPSTFEGGYGGSQGESAGIIGILELISADITKDITKADTDEGDAVTAHGKFEEDLDADILALNNLKSDTNTAMSDSMEAKGLEETDKNTNGESLTADLSYLKKLAPGCDFMAVNFNTRMTNRQAEVDGLNKAKAILNGAGAQ